MLDSNYSVLSAELENVVFEFCKNVAANVTKIKKKQINHFIMKKKENLIDYNDLMVEFCKFLNSNKSLYYINGGNETLPGRS